MKKDQRDDSQEEKSTIKHPKMEVMKSLERTFYAQIGVLGMSDSQTNTTASALMRQCQQNMEGDKEGKKKPAKTVPGHV